MPSTLPPPSNRITTQNPHGVTVTTMRRHLRCAAKVSQAAPLRRSCSGGGGGGGVTASSFTHVDSSKDVSMPSMVDVSAKKTTSRVAVAEAILRVSDGHDYALHRAHEKVLGAAALSACVNTYKTIPFCHPLEPLSVDCALDFPSSDRVVVRVTASTAGKTGVEMEALAGAAFAALTLVNVSTHPRPTVERVLLRHKSGGKSGAVNFDDDARAV